MEEPTGPYTPYIRTTADNRYSELLDEIERRLGPGPAEHDLVNELDEVVGIRLAETQDRMGPLVKAAAAVFDSWNGDPYAAALHQRLNALESRAERIEQQLLESLSGGS